MQGQGEFSHRVIKSLECQPEILSHCSQVTSNYNYKYPLSALKLLAEICEVEQGQPMLRCWVSQALVKLSTNLADRAAQLNLKLTYWHTGPTLSDLHLAMSIVDVVSQVVATNQSVITIHTRQTPGTSMCKHPITFYR